MGADSLGRWFRSWLATILILTMADGVGGCHRQPTPTPMVSHAVVKRAQIHMGTLVTLTAVAPKDPIAQEAVAEGFKLIRILEAQWSTWMPTSEVSLLNAAAGRSPVRVSAPTMALLARSVEIAHLTEGAFNIAMGPVVEAWGISTTPQVPTAQHLDALRPLLDLSALHLNPERQTAFLAKAGMRLDVGGIGKGYAADLVAEAMRRHGATAGVIALAGDIKTFGVRPDGSHFVIGIQHPRKPGVSMATLEVENEAISTAGDYERVFEQDGVMYHHILDPRTLQPARTCQSVTVIAKEGIWADGLDTGIFVLGPERGMALIESLPNVEGFIVDREGQVTTSSGLQGRLKVDQD